ncbi:hypothetical protein LEP1GSC202_1886 [Leptospira yanagawae serovar Saopaulo str. Sao Paulo = ATCC 700523]|uniref:Uncharacterized protein n=1 Tax=Leptospira yanagawae serovar Saopaulo str. Sao Paulo = ATCC 700523 TaxID=1249483 RepID=A0A5E8HDF5_9LEPT|nr:hypothetical protein [Leptospira yanagawae]EOQ89269.1 hypothetical protein LEP1GSC202_1886 [Leptospira yanagawae serovar Saopaulo str. Sao Paulo = ATCC 700523]
MIENRNIEFYEWKLTDKAKRIIRQKWNELYLVQETHIQNQKRLEEDWEWKTSTSKEDPLSYTIPGFGYFTNLPDPDAPYPKLFSFTKEELEQINRKIESLQSSQQKSNPNHDIKPNHLPETKSAFQLITSIQTDTQTFIETERRLFVRRFLQKPVQLYEQAFVRLDHKDFSLTEEEVITFQNYLSELKNELKTCLLLEECNDWEEMTLLLRIIYTHRSIGEKTIVFPRKNFQGFSYIEYLNLPESVFITKQKEYGLLIKEKRDEFIKSYHPIHYYNWESLLGKYLSFIEGKTYTEGIEFNWLGKNPYENQNFQLNKTIDSDSYLKTKTKWETYTKNVQSLYSYHLVFQNCTNELFQYMNLMFPNGNIEGQQFWEPLGSHWVRFNFVPSIAALKLANSRYTEKIKIFPSYRNLKRNALKTWREKNIKESFVFTSEIYKPNPLDHSFLFFTEETIWNRPILGFANVIWGIGYTGMGIVKSPMDRGKSFVAGTETIFYSVPELFFFNIRKGHFPLITAEEIPKEYYENTIE